MPSITATTTSSIVVPSRAADRETEGAHREPDAGAGGGGMAPAWRVTDAASLSELIETLLPRPAGAGLAEEGRPVEAPDPSLVAWDVPAPPATTSPIGDAGADGLVEVSAEPSVTAPAAEAAPAADAADEHASRSGLDDGSARLAALIAEQRRLIERMAEVSRSLHLPDRSDLVVAAVADASVPVPATRAATQPPPLPITEPTLVAEPDPAATGLVRAIAVAGRFFSPRRSLQGAEGTIAATTTPAAMTPPAPDDATAVPATPDEVRITIPETMAVARAELVPSPLPAFLVGVAASLLTGVGLYWALVQV